MWDKTSFLTQPVKTGTLPMYIISCPLQFQNRALTNLYVIVMFSRWIL